MLLISIMNKRKSNKGTMTLWCEGVIKLKVLPGLDRGIGIG